MPPPHSKVTSSRLGPDGPPGGRLHFLEGHRRHPPGHAQQQGAGGDARHRAGDGQGCFVNLELPPGSLLTSVLYCRVSVLGTLNWSLYCRVPTDYCTVLQGPYRLVAEPVAPRPGGLGAAGPEVADTCVEDLVNIIFLAVFPPLAPAPSPVILAHSVSSFSSDSASLIPPSTLTLTCHPPACHPAGIQQHLPPRPACRSHPA